MSKWIPLFLAAAPLAGCGAAPVDDRAGLDDAALLHAAVADLTRVMIYDILSPPQASRTYAYASIAGYEAIRHDDPAFRSLAGQLNGLAPVPAPEPDVEYHFPLAGAHAFLTAGRALTFSQERVDSLRTALHRRARRAGVSAAVVERSIGYGDRVARHILDWADADGFRETRGYPKFTVVADSGRWLPTPPAYMDALEPSWSELRPFVLDSASQFRPPPPEPFDMADGSAFHEQVMAVYRAVRELTDEQREIALFWDDNPYVMHVRGHAMFATKKATPGGHWMGIAQIAARRAGAGPVASAEAYALTAIALADGFIACWDEKFRSNVIRPETVINAYIDEAWLPVLQTPPFPEYTSGHSVISTAAARVLTEIFGADFGFEDTTEAEFGLGVRTFASFEEAAAEAAISRLYGGIHYPMAIEEGIAQGRRIGDLVIERVATRAADALASR